MWFGKAFGGATWQRSSGYHGLHWGRGRELRFNQIISPNVHLQSSLHYVQIYTLPSQSYHSSSGIISRTYFTPFNITERDRRIRLHNLNDSWVPLSSIARPGAPAIKPIHIPASIPPNTKNEYHAPRQRFAHFSHTTKRHEP